MRQSQIFFLNLGISTHDAFFANVKKMDKKEKKMMKKSDENGAEKMDLLFIVHKMCHKECKKNSKKKKRLSSDEKFESLDCI